jgi:hypothetical protein
MACLPATLPTFKEETLIDSVTLSCSHLYVHLEVVVAVVGGLVRARSRVEVVVVGGGGLGLFGRPGHHSRGWAGASGGGTMNGRTHVRVAV